MDTKVTYPTGVPGITVVGSADQGKTRIVRTLTGFGSGVKYGVHNSTINNLIRGVAERVLYLSEGGVLLPSRKPKAKVFERLTGVKLRLLRHLRPTTVVTPEDYPGLYTGRKQAVYKRAYESLLSKGLQRKDAYVSTFVKAEKVNFSAKDDPAPRVIQPRTPRYNLCVGRYLKLFEKGLSQGFAQMCGYRVILKCLNADSVATQLRENWMTFRDPVAFGLDASRFDQHVSVDALKFEHSVYNSVFKSPELARLLSWQLHNKGFGRIGEALVKYTVEGCRMSGDINTGMGNCLIMSCIVLAYFDHIGVVARLANNGDDCVVVCERRDEPKFSGISEWFTDFGFKLKREATTDIFERIEFCQTQPVLVGGAYRMVRNPWSAMSKDCLTMLPIESLAQFNTWRDAIGTCGLELTRGVPVWESFYRALQDTGCRSGGLERIRDSGMGYMARGVRDSVVDEESRYSFWLAFSIDPDLQRIMERSWPGIVFDPEPPLISINEIKHFTENPLRWLQHATTD